jgi:CheY-like chemotaxis protein
LPSSDYAPHLNGLNILVVDDEVDTRDLLRATLSECGAQVDVAGSVTEAFALMAACLPDVIISDIGMPDEDGYDLIRRLRSMPLEGGGKVPAIALTAYARVEDRLKALRAGFQMHVPKPVELAELVTVVASVAGRNVQEYPK